MANFYQNEYNIPQMQENLIKFLSSILNHMKKSVFLALQLHVWRSFLWEKFFLQNCEKLKKRFFTVLLITVLIFDQPESNIPQKEGNFL